MKWLAIGALSAVAVASLAAILFVTNATPTVPALSAGEVADRTRPYLIKLHAQWCPVCMSTKGVWAMLSEQYTHRVRLVVFDFTGDATTEASRIEAKRLGLAAVFDEYVGETGTILVVDGASQEVLHSIHGSRDVADYRAAIDRVLAK